MKKHHYLLIGLVLVAGAGYYIWKEHKCKCKAGDSNCKCGGKKVAVTATATAPALPTANAGAGTAQKVIPSTGLPGTFDDILAPQDNWSNADGGPGAAAAVQNYNDSFYQALHFPKQKVKLNY